ncbi:MAG: NAD(P)H-dependent oxidoreductase subunit E [Gemmatimonadales bacterium]|jgi:NADH:ubiquinone oxidoreductase subunit F (NADH-binding)/NADH:ubiquinone oxidoreductase subunit E
MSLIHELERLQEERGFLAEDALRELAHASKTPLYRLQELISFYPHFRTTPPSPTTVHVCRDMSCHLAGGDGLAERLRDALDREDVEIEEVSCLGCCELAPAVRVNGAPARAGDAGELAGALSNGGPAATTDTGPREWACDPYGGDPGGAYECFRQTLAQIDREGALDSLISALEDAGLRGMGGAGFPTGRKWKLVRSEDATPKYVVCNADESEPGTFKDRVIMEQLPWLVLEGMLLAGLAIGAERGILYLRHEYHAARAAIERELARAREQGWLGEEILGSDFSFDIELFISPGGYILGEETALLEALEDRRGEPRNKPPFPGQKGLWQQPTLMNNVETFAYVPIIGLKGADWWHEQGRRGCKGLKCIAVSGHVEEPGVYEIPLGTTVAELIELAGGVSGGRDLKGFAPGGASSNFLPASKADTPIDFGTLADAGSMMGSGALVVFAEGTEMLPLATNVVRFFRNESCGKCVPCRDGTEKAVRMLEDALAGGTIDRAAIDKLQLLLEETSICGLGYVALNPLLSAAAYWPEEVPTAARAADGGEPA